jgi:branched-subunit amino acid transport protein
VAFEGDAIRPLGPWYVALAIAVAVAAWRRSVGWTLVLGMASLWVLEAIW